MPTRHAVAAARMYVMLNAENIVKRRDFEDKRTTIAENPTQMAAALTAVLNICPVVSFL